MPLAAIAWPVRAKPSLPPRSRSHSDGEVSPIVRDIAQMAGVSARTVFQHFADTAELYVAVLGRVMASVVGEAPQLNRPVVAARAAHRHRDRPARRPLRDSFARCGRSSRRCSAARPDAAAMICCRSTAANTRATSRRPSRRSWRRCPAESRQRTLKALGAGPGARELGRAAPAARPVGRAVARGAQLRREVGRSRPRPRAANARQVAPTSSSVAVAQTELAEMGDRVPHIVEVAAGGALP